MSPTIRQARAHDATALSALAMRSKAHWGYAGAQLAAWKSDLTITSEYIVATQTFLAEEQGKAMGFYAIAAATASAPDSWQLEHFWIAPEAMGLGLGRALFSHAAGIVRRGGAKAIAIDADPHAEAFYIKCGATRMGAEAAPIAGDPDRVRPQLLFTLAAATPSPTPA